MLFPEGDEFFQEIIIISITLVRAMNKERDQILSLKISSKQLKYIFSEKYKLHIKQLKVKSDLWC